ncbi:TetR/AcrR family transcriptional regulator [Noviherbaspirillum sedimenti]|uniref:TetR/AcrR family transcriptional regulator n=1 Tax=Noviherbaspirillum sedimenti TaxID=2320865 RepID=A0A3A3G7E5_9BURK|nr:TetR/AcrR family transcriptional regulator [Noviherbaspirillum sedimenti]RJG02659.1 TetR/AcrR family transcriptional regulator [Noviherbaspirillum sedimenti]
MSRIRADDYEEKKNGILSVAAALFADQGYSGCKMQDIAKACNVSKSMLYHYFEKKEDVLYEILSQHLLRIVTLFEEYQPDLGTNETDINQYFRTCIALYLERSKASRARHVVALHDRRYLTSEQKSKIVKLERDILDRVSTVLQKVDSSYEQSEYRAHSLLLIGMMNWVELWYRSSGKISPDDFYDKVTNLFLHGFVKERRGVGVNAR